MIIGSFCLLYICAMKGVSMKNSHSPDKIAEVLKILAYNDYNWSKTERETGVRRATLKSWRKKEQSSITKIKANESIMGVENPLDSILPFPNNLSFAESMKYTRQLAVERLNALLPIERDSQKVINIIDKLTQFIGDVQPPEEGSNKGGNFFWQVNNLLIQNQHGKNKSIDQGDKPSEVN